MENKNKVLYYLCGEQILKDNLETVNLKTKIILIIQGILSILMLILSIVFFIFLIYISFFI